MNTVRQSVSRSFNLRVASVRAKKSDDIDDLVLLVRKIEKSSFATMEEKFFTLILNGLHQGKLHIWWDLLTTEGTFMTRKFLKMALKSHGIFFR